MSAKNFSRRTHPNEKVACTPTRWGSDPVPTLLPGLDQQMQLTVVPMQQQHVD